MIKRIKNCKRGTRFVLFNENRELEVYVTDALDVDVEGFTVVEFEQFDEFSEDLPLWVAVPGNLDRTAAIRRGLMFLKRNSISYGFLSKEELFGDEKKPEWEHVGAQWIRIRSLTFVKELDFDAFFTKKWASFVWVYAHEGTIYIYQTEKEALAHLRHDVEAEIGTSWENYLPNVGNNEKMEPDSVEMRGQSWAVWKEVIR